jgi:Glycosyltransferase 61
VQVDIVDSNNRPLQSQQIQMAFQPVLLSHFLLFLSLLLSLSSLPATSASPFAERGLKSDSRGAAGGEIVDVGGIFDARRHLRRAGADSSGHERRAHTKGVQAVASNAGRRGGKKRRPTREIPRKSKIVTGLVVVSRNSDAEQGEGDVGLDLPNDWKEDKKVKERKEMERDEEETNQIIKKDDDGVNRSSERVMTNEQTAESDVTTADQSPANDSRTSFDISTNVVVNESSIRIIRSTGLSADKPVCRIEGICRAGDGSYLLPTWMRMYSKPIQDCGIKTAYYVLHETATLKDVSSRSVWLIKDFPRKSMTLSEDFSDFDLIGGKAPRAEKQWLVTDLAPTIFMMDMALRFDDVQKRGKIAAVQCVTRGGKICSEPSMFSNINPMILVDVRISEQQSYLWPKGFLRLIRNGFSGSLQVTDLQDMYGWRMRSQASCIRSLITSRASIEDLPRGAFESDNFLFRANALSRESARLTNASSPLAPSQAVSIPVPSKIQCRVNVLLLNKYGKRYMIGDTSLRTAIESIARKIVRKRHPGVDIVPEIVFFESSSFHEQVSVMQETSVVVSSHGDSNANIIFLRPESSLIEVMPFGLGPVTYSNLAKAFGVKYQTVMAQPDDEVFRSCIEHFNNGNGNAIDGESGDHESVRRLLERWEVAGTAFRAESEQTRGEATSNFRIGEEPDEIEKPLHRDGVSRARQCATYQRLAFNIDHVARLVIREGLEICGVNDAATIATIF